MSDLQETISRMALSLCLRPGTTAFFYLLLVSPGEGDSTFQLIAIYFIPAILFPWYLQKSASFCLSCDP